MNACDSSKDSDVNESLLGKVAEEYFSAVERGEHPSLAEYAKRYPEIAEEILAAFPALAILGDSVTSSTASVPLPFERPLKELGDYRLIREIGRGGMGIVYEAEQLSLGRRVAVKVLPFAGMLDDRQLQRFKNEARAAATLHHPHIVPVYSVGCERGVHFYAMQLIEGQSLSEVIAYKKRQRVGRSDSEDTLLGQLTDEHSDRLDSAVSLSAPEDCDQSNETNHLKTSSTLSDAKPRDYFLAVARLGIEAAEALGHAHERGIIHRDVKPANLLLDDAGKLWLTDMGLAQFESNIGLTRTGDVVGTLNYMSPEQALGQGMIDQRTDVYSLGATLYELATLQPPFAGAGRKEMVHKIASQEPTRPRLINGHLPIDLDTIICKAMKKDMPDRYVNATELARDLRRFVNCQPILARPPSLLERVGKWSRRHVAVVWTLLAAALAGIVLLTLSIALISRSRSGMEAALIKAEVHEQRLSESLYAADMRLAGQAWKENDPARAIELLEQHVPSAGQRDLRDLEWHFLHSRCSAAGVELARTGSPIHDFAFSPNGSMLALVGQDAVLHVYDWPAMTVVTRIPTDQGELNGVAFSDDGATIATVGDNGELRLWQDFSNPSHRAIKAHDGRAYDVVCSQRLKRWITCGEDGAIKLFDQATGESQGELFDGGIAVTLLEVTDDDKTLASAENDGRLRLWNLDEQIEIRTINRYDRRSTAMAFDERKQALIAGGLGAAVTTGLIRWDLSDGRAETLNFSAHKVTGLAIPPDGRFLAIAADDGVLSKYALDSSTFDGRVPEMIWRRHTAKSHEIAFTPDGSHLLSAGGDGVLRAFRESGDDHRTIWQTPSSHVDVIDRVGSLPLVAVAGPYDLSIADVQTGELVRKIANGNYEFIDVSPDGSLLAARTATHDVSVWSRTAAGYKLEATRRFPYKASHLQFSPDNSILAVTNVREDNGLHLVDWRTWQEQSGLIAHGCRRFMWSPDGSFFVVAENASDDVIVFDARSRRERWRRNGHSSSIEGMDVSYDSRLIASADDERRVCVWEAATGNVIWSATSGAASAVMTYPRSLQFSPAGRTLFSLQVNGQLTAWNVATGREMLCLDDAGQSGPCLTICGNGNYICAGMGKRLRVIDTGYDE